LRQQQQINFAEETVLTRFTTSHYNLRNSALVLFEATANYLFSKYRPFTDLRQISSKIPARPVKYRSSGNPMLNPEQDFSVWPFWSEPFRSGRFSLAISVWGHFGHDISVHKQLITTFLYLNYYIGRRNVTLYGVIPCPFSGVMVAIKSEL